MERDDDLRNLILDAIDTPVSDNYNYKMMRKLRQESEDDKKGTFDKILGLSFVSSGLLLLIVNRLGIDIDIIKISTSLSTIIEKIF